MTPRIRRLICIILCICLFPGAAYADGGGAEDVPQRPALDAVPVYVASLLSGRAFISRDTAYMSLADIGEIYAVDISLDIAGGSFSASAPGLELYGEKGSGYLQANFRYIYIPTDYIVCGEDVYLPVDALGRIFGLKCSVADDRVDISTRQVRMISGSEDYYDTHFSADELYWLPHIAYVEALDEPLAGIMGVCTVVLNRVADEDFPDTIFEVIYDSKHQVQFTPAATGSLHGKPDELYYIAAYLVLEGYNTVGKSLYFVNPANNGNYWFRESLAYVTTIGDHEFYR